jgi:hypothetical protein
MVAVYLVKPRVAVREQFMLMALAFWRMIAGLVMEVCLMQNLLPIQTVRL